MTYDVVIVGAGPAGLATGYVLSKRGIKFIIIEQGRNYLERNYSSPFDVSCGFGGGGLFSDGKFSYPPAASQLWTKMNPKRLKEAYDVIDSLFSSVNIELDRWSEEWTKQIKYNIEKEYKSIKLGNEQRSELLQLLYNDLKDNIVFNEIISNISEVRNHYIVDSVNGNKYSTRAVVMATGKSSSANIFHEDFFKKSSYFAEMGVRIEVKNENFTPRAKEQVDYKVIENIDECTELRTFCCCQSGEIRMSCFGDHITYNGETRNEDTGYSNIGILIRTNNPNSIYAHEMKECFNMNVNKKINIRDYNETEFIIGKNIDGILKSMIRRLVDSDEEGVVYGPEIEKYGFYPQLTVDLELQNNLYFIGDSTGLFRGLMAAFVSGAYVGLLIVEQKRKNIKNYMERLHIKQSDTEDMKLVFTAQSKAFFYCRDVICQFVLEKGYLPINPFRVFEYFLGDRVDRDLIRRGNNQLIRTCEELWVFGQIADGVLFEIASAIEQGKKIRFFTIGTKIEEIEEISVEDIRFEPEVHSYKIKKNDLISFIKDYNLQCEEMLDKQISIFELNPELLSVKESFFK